MEVVDIVMPIEEGRFIPHAVIEGILEQSCTLRLWISTKHSDGDYAAARNNVKKYGSSPMVLMLDNDIVLPPGAIERMSKFLDGHQEYAAIGISKDSIPVANGEILDAEHVDMSCVLFRQEILDRITFSQGHPFPGKGRCECLQCCDDIRQMGMKIGFLVGLQVYHILNTRSQ